MAKRKHPSPRGYAKVNSPAVKQYGGTIALHLTREQYFALDAIARHHDVPRGVMALRLLLPLLEPKGTPHDRPTAQDRPSNQEDRK